MMDFKLDLDMTLPFREYTKRFARLIYEPLIGAGFQNVSKCADAIANDSFMTYVNLLFNVQTVALASVMMAAARYKHPLPCSQPELISK